MIRATLAGQGAVSVPNSDLLIGVTDLAVGVADGDPVLYAVGRGGGALTRFDLGTGASPATLAGSWGIPEQYLQIESTDILLVPGTGGTTHVLLAGLANGDLRGRIETGTSLGGNTVFDAGSFDLGQIRSVTLSPDGSGALASLRGGGLVQLSFGTNGQVSVSTPSGQGALGSERADAVSWIDAGGFSYAVATYAGSDQIALLREGAGGQLSLVDTVDAADGAWVDSPSAVVTLTGPDGAAYVVMAASGSASLTVLAIEGNALRPVDHVIDTLDTRFDDVTQLAVMEIGGQPYLVAAGSDQGLTVLTLMPGGQLLEVATLAASVDTPLNGISALDVVVTGDGARIFVATQGAPYLVEFSFALGNAGTTVTGTPESNVLTGTGADDVIWGDAGDDTIDGGAGNDLLADGAGTDRLIGGAGADTFIFEADGVLDWITDFQRGTDSLQLRAPTPGLGLDDVLVIQRNWGAEIRIGTEVLRVASADGNPLTWADFDDGVLSLSASISVDPADHIDDAPDIGPEGGGDLDPTLFFAKPQFGLTAWAEPVIQPAASAQSGGRGNDTLTGGSGADQLLGEGGNDLLQGNAGVDVLIGAAGFDTLYGGAGNDSMSGGANADVLYGGTGNDVMVGGDGFDLLYGEAGADEIWGGDGPDRIWGGDGDDWLSGGFNFGFTVDGVDGGAGNDTILGEVGFDLLIGGDGNDVIDGGHQADNIYGDAGQDTLYGNLGFDRLFGGEGDDILYGGAGPDTHFGQGGNDRMWGGTENDRFFGGAGNDYIVGEEGDDILGGNAGFDTLIGGAGDDLLYGDFNADRFVFANGHGHDRVFGFDAGNVLEVLDFSGLLAFTGTSQVLEQATQVGGNVVITTGADSSITLVGVDLADLDGTDFLF